jgi:hypothetical protein
MNNRNRETKNGDSKKKEWTEGKNSMEKLIENVKKIGFYQGI